jgi:C4-dicarboxylate transporter, DctM subunit
MIYSRMGAAASIERANWGERMRATILALPTVILAIVIIVSIYAGIATPSESAGVGFVVAMIMTFLMGRMNWTKLKQAVSDSLTTTAMIFIIIAGAKVFSYAITLYLIPQAISGYLLDNISSPTVFILAVGIVLLIVGFFLESLSMMLIMVPVLFPALSAMNIDPVWFGIFFVVLIETALITPPVGLNLFIIQAVGKARLESVVKGAWPFAVMMLCTAALLWFWKDLVLYIPYQLF